MEYQRNPASGRRLLPFPGMPERLYSGHETSEVYGDSYRMGAEARLRVAGQSTTRRQRCERNRALARQSTKRLRCSRKHARENESVAGRLSLASVAASCSVDVSSRPKALGFPCIPVSQSCLQMSWQLQCQDRATAAQAGQEMMGMEIRPEAVEPTSEKVDCALTLIGKGRAVKPVWVVSDVRPRT